MVGSVFDLDRLRGRPDPASAPADEPEMQVTCLAIFGPVEA